MLGIHRSEAREEGSDREGRGSSSHTHHLGPSVEHTASRQNGGQARPAPAGNRLPRADRDEPRPSGDVLPFVSVPAIVGVAMPTFTYEERVKVCKAFETAGFQEALRRHHGGRARQPQRLEWKPAPAFLPHVLLYMRDAIQRIAM